MADIEAVVDLANASELHDIGETFVEKSDVESDWSGPSADLEADVLLVFEDETLVASAVVWDERADVFVLPRARGLGIGTELILWTEKRARSQAAEKQIEPRVGQTVPEASVDAIVLLKQHGYEPLWHSWVLRVPEDKALIERPLADVSIRQFDFEEEFAVYQVIDAAFSEWEGRESKPFDAWQARVTQRPDFDPSLLLVAEVEGRIVGAAVGIPYPGDGWVDQVAVDRHHRSQGIGTALLVRLFNEFRSRGETRLGLNTDSRTGALDLYLNFGMYVEHTFTRWSKALD
jgi:GNAT superfamily N-acetyltransferase